MKYYGTIDKKGRAYIPAELRLKTGLNVGERIVMEASQEGTINISKDHEIMYFGLAAEIECVRLKDAAIEIYGDTATLNMALDLLQRYLRKANYNAIKVLLCTVYQMYGLPTDLLEMLMDCEEYYIKLSQVLAMTLDRKEKSDC